MAKKPKTRNVRLGKINKIVEALRQGGPLSAKEMAQHVSAPPRTVRYDLDRLEEWGVVVELPNGKYHLKDLVTTVQGLRLAPRHSEDLKEVIHLWLGEMPSLNHHDVTFLRSGPGGPAVPGARTVAAVFNPGEERLAAEQHPLFADLGNHLPKCAGTWADIREMACRIEEIRRNLWEGLRGEAGRVLGLDLVRAWGSGDGFSRHLVDYLLSGLVRAAEDPDVFRQIYLGAGRHSDVQHRPNSSDAKQPPNSEYWLGGWGMVYLGSRHPEAPNIESKVNGALDTLLQQFPTSPLLKEARTLIRIAQEIDGKMLVLKRDLALAQYYPILPGMCPFLSPGLVPLTGTVVGKT